MNKFLIYAVLGVLSGIHLFGCSETPSLSVVDVDGLTSASNVAWNADEFAIAKGSDSTLYTFMNSITDGKLAGKRQNSLTPSAGTVDGDMWSTWDNPWDYDLNNDGSESGEQGGVRQIAAGLNNADGKIYLFGIRVSDSKLLYRVQETGGSSWKFSNWNAVNADGNSVYLSLTHDLKVTIGDYNAVAVFGVEGSTNRIVYLRKSTSSTDPAVFKKQYVGNQTIHWTNTYAVCRRKPTSSSSSFKLAVFINDPGNNIWYNFQPASGDWSGTSYQSFTFSGSIGADIWAINEGNNARIFAINGNGYVYTRKESYGTWSSLTQISALGECHPRLAVAKDGSGYIYVLATQNTFVENPYGEWEQPMKLVRGNNSWTTVTIPENSNWMNDGGEKPILAATYTNNGTNNGDVVFMMVKHIIFRERRDIWTLWGSNSGSHFSQWRQTGFFQSEMP